MASRFPVLADLFRVKTIAEITAASETAGDGHGSGLKRALGSWDLMLLGVGAIIGAGILSALGTGLAGGYDSNVGYTRPGAGPALIVSFVLTAIACGFTALCYAELASMIPVSGSAYTYAYATLGELMAWIIGWDLLLEYAVSNVAVAISWGSYATGLLAAAGIVVPPWLATDPRTLLQLSEQYSTGHPGISLSEKLAELARARAGEIDGGAIFAHWDTLATTPIAFGFPVAVNLLAMFITIVITALCVWGVRESVRANNVLVALKVLLLVGVVIIGARHVDMANFHPFMPNGWKGVQAGAAIIFFAFIGFDAVSTTAEECKDPARDMPRGILGSLVICTILYIGVATVIAGMRKYTDYAGVADPIAHAFKSIGMNGVAAAVSIGAVIAIAAALLVYQLAQPRIFMVMSRDGLLPKWFGEVSPRFHTPVNATLFTGLVVVVPAGFMNIDEIVELTNIGTLFAFVLVCVGVLVLRVKQPDAQRKFKVPAVWLCGPLGIGFCTWLAAGLPPATWRRFWIWLAVGLVIYLFYGARQARQRRAAVSERQMKDA